MMNQTENMKRELMTMLADAIGRLNAIVRKHREENPGHFCSRDGAGWCDEIAPVYRKLDLTRSLFTCTIDSTDAAVAVETLAGKVTKYLWRGDP